MVASCSAYAPGSLPPSVGRFEAVALPYPILGSIIVLSIKEPSNN